PPTPPRTPGAAPAPRPPPPARARAQAPPAGPAPLLDEHGDRIRARLWDATDNRETHGDGVRAQKAAAPPLAPSHRPESSNGMRLPLAGLRELELTANMIGPLTGRYLAVLGADVIQVPSPRRPPP